MFAQPAAVFPYTERSVQHSELKITLPGTHEVSICTADARIEFTTTQICFEMHIL